MQPQRLNRLRDGIASGQGVLFLGPGFGRRSDAIQIDPILETLVEDAVETTGWEALEQDERFMLLNEEFGREPMIDRLCQSLPTYEALTPEVSDFDRKLLGLPFPMVVDANLHDLSLAALTSIDAVVCPLNVDNDTVTRSEPLEGERIFVNLRDDLQLGSATLTLDQLRIRAQENPSLFALIKTYAARGPVLFYGFAPQDPFLEWMVHFLAPLSTTAVLATQVTNPLWRKYWSGRGFEVLSAGTYPELEEKILSLMEEVIPSIDISHFDPLLMKLAEQTQKTLAKVPELEWTHLEREGLDGLKKDDLKVVRSSMVLLERAFVRGIMVPPRMPAIAAELFLKAGDVPFARRGLRLTGQAQVRWPKSDPIALAALGRTLNRMGDIARSRIYLTKALNSPERTDVERADDLAWLSRSVLEQIDRLSVCGRNRGVMELIASFLSQNAERLNLALVDPGDDDLFKWSVYYINLRLGRIMGLASEMALSSGQVYAQQAITLLTRAIELVPMKPEAYKWVRPLLTDRRFGNEDTKKWMALVASAPPSVQRRLGGR